MKDNTVHNEHDGRRRTVEDGQTSAEDTPTASYTPQQRRLIRKGLRILARVAIRSHMRGHGGRHQPEDMGEQGS